MPTKGKRKTGKPCNKAAGKSTRSKGERVVSAAQKAGELAHALEHHHPLMGPVSWGYYGQL